MKAVSVALQLGSGFLLAPLVVVGVFAAPAVAPSLKGFLFFSRGFVFSNTLNTGIISSPSFFLGIRPVAQDLVECFG